MFVPANTTGNGMHLYVIS